jgi:hypothetical protein
MRKIEKTLNIKNANILAEQRYVQEKLGLSENLMSEGESVEDFFNFIESDPRLNSFSYLDYTSTLDRYLSKPKSNPMSGKFIKVTRYKFLFGQSYARAAEIKNPEYNVQQRKGEYTKVQGYSVLEFDKGGNLVLPIVPKEAKSKVFVLDDNNQVVDTITTREIKDKYAEYFTPSFFNEKPVTASGTDFRALKVDSISKISAGGKTWKNPNFKFKNLTLPELNENLEE